MKNRQEEMLHGMLDSRLKIKSPSISEQGVKVEYKPCTVGHLSLQEFSKLLKKIIKHEVNEVLNEYRGNEKDSAG